MTFRLAAIILLCLVPLQAPAAVAVPEPGQLLVARAELPDVRFRNAVVLLFQSGPQGAVGLIVNRPSRLPLAEALPDLPALAAATATLAYGGPVAPEVLLVLLQTVEETPESARRVSEGLYLTAPEPLSAWLEKGRTGARFLVLSGYAGWAPGQLEEELARADWQVSTATAQELFSVEPASLWETLSARGSRVGQNPGVP